MCSLLNRALITQPTGDSKLNSNWEIMEEVGQKGLLLLAIRGKEF